MQWAKLTTHQVKWPFKELWLQNVERSAYKVIKCNKQNERGSENETSITCVIAAWDLRKINKSEERCNESDSKQDLSSNER